MKNLLVIHHERRDTDSSIYLTDDYYAANNSLYGAQELDTWAGYRILSILSRVWRLSICTNYKYYKLYDPKGRLLEKGNLNAVSKFEIFKRKDFDWLTILSNSSTSQYLDFDLKRKIEIWISRYDINLVWAETQFFLAITPKEFPLVVRSVNFEPYHVLYEDSSKFKYAKVLPRLLLESTSGRRSHIVPISPLDESRYCKFGIQTSEYIPLRQFAFINEESLGDKESIQDFVFLSGSNYQIKHNRKNLEILLREVAPKIQDIYPEMQFRVYGHRVPSLPRLSSNVKIMGFVESYQHEIRKARAAIVPGLGGAGMQSKIFEPLILGIPTISHLKNLSGIDSKHFPHFYPITSTTSTVEGIIAVMESSQKSRINSSVAHLPYSFSLDALTQRTLAIIQKMSI